MYRILPLGVVPLQVSSRNKAVETMGDIHGEPSLVKVRLLGKGVIVYTTHPIHRRIERVVRTITPLLYSERFLRTHPKSSETQRFLGDRLIVHFFYPKDGTPRRAPTKPAPSATTTRSLRP